MLSRVLVDGDEVGEAAYQPTSKLLVSNWLSYLKAKAQLLC